MTPHKRDSIRIGTSADVSEGDKIRELESKLAQRDQELKVRATFIQSH